MTFPISSFNDNKVTLDQELAERTVAYRDLTHMEMQHMIQKHRKFYWYFKHLPVLFILLIIYEIILFYLNFEYFKVDLNELFFALVILPPFFIYTGYQKEKQYFADVNLPVVKTVGTLKTVEIKHRRGRVTRYFEVEGVKFGKNNNDSSVIELVFTIFGVNQSYQPIRIEYSPTSGLIWEIKKRNTNGWETVYDSIPEKFEHEPIRLIIPSNQKRPLQVS